MLLCVIYLQGIVGDPGERGASGQKGKPVSVTDQPQREMILFD